LVRRSDCLDTPKPPQIGIASIVRPVPLLLDSPTNANLPLLPLGANTPAMQIDRVVASKLVTPVLPAAPASKIPVRNGYEITS
jgi:hypothetical protein